VRLTIHDLVPFEFPASARSTGLNPLRAFPAWLSPANYLPIPFTLRAALMSVTWVAVAVYTYNTYVAGFIGAHPLGPDIGALVFLVAVFFLGRIFSYILMVTLVVMVIRSLTAVSLLGAFYSPVGLFVLILWLLAFGAQPEQAPDRAVHEVQQ
jgi:hypothetical protein